MRRLLPVALLAACAPAPFVATRLTAVPATRLAAPSTANPGRWWSVVLHAHSVLNFVWIYERVAEVQGLERADRSHRDRGREARMRLYDPEGAEKLLLRAARGGADALVLTEHNTLLHAEDPWLPARRGRTRLFRQATEWTTLRGGGHALVFGLRESLRPTNSATATVSDFERLAARARAQGAVIVIAHPTTPRSPWKERIPDGVHAVEVLNSWPFDFGRSESLWHEALRRGSRIAAVAAADWHATPGPPLPWDWRATLVRSADLDEGGIYRAIARGRTVAVAGRRPRVRLEVVVAGRCREGDECRVHGGRPFDIEVRVAGASGLDLEILDEASPSPAEPAARVRVSRRSFRAAFRRTLPRGARGFVRAALRGSSTVALGSAVYLIAPRAAPLIRDGAGARAPRRPAPTASATASRRIAGSSAAPRDR